MAATSGKPSTADSPSQPATPTAAMPSTDELMKALKNPATD
jgi:hypothetical protein